jgi:surfactin synthase thioesterase subunit
MMRLFLAAGADAFKKDLKDVQISLLEGGHFVLEEKHAEALPSLNHFSQKKGSNNSFKRVLILQYGRPGSIHISQ